MGSKPFRKNVIRAPWRSSLLALLGLTACEGGPTAPDLMPEPEAPVSVVMSPDPTTDEAVPVPAHLLADLAGELTEELAALLDGSFTFLAPLPEEATTGAFDAGVLPALEVEVCAVAACGTSPVVVYTSTSGQGSSVVRIDPVAEHFIVNWDTDAFALDMSLTYRVRVLTSGLEVGSLDVVLVNNGGQAKDASTGSTIALKDGRVLPVKFSVTRNRLIAAWILVAQGGSANEVAALLDGEFGSSPEETTAILAFAGFGAGEVSGALRIAFGLSAAEAAEVLIGGGLVSGAGSTARALSDGGYPTIEVTQVLRDFFSLGASEAGAALLEGGFDAGDTGSALREVFGLTLPDAVTALHDAGFEGAEVGGWIQTQPDAPQDLEGVAALLGQAGYGIEGVAGYLAASGVEGDEALTSALLGAGYSLPEVADWLVDDQGRTEGEAAGLLQAAGGAAGDIGDWLLTRELSESSVVVALREAGFGAGPTGDWLLETLGKTEEAAGILLANAGHEIEDVGDWLLGHFEAIGDNALGKTAAVLKKTVFAFDRVGNWIFDKAGQVESRTAGIFKFAGYTAGEAVEFFHGSLGRAGDKIAGFLAGAGYGAVETAQALVEKANATVDLVAGILDAVYDLSAAQAATVLAEIGSAASEVGDALLNIFNQTVGDAATLLGQAGFPVGDAAEWIFDGFGSGQDALEQTAAVLHDSFSELQAELQWLADKSREIHDLQTAIIANFLAAGRAGGYGADESGPFVQAEFNLPTVDVGEYLAGAGYVAGEVASALTTMGASAIEIAESLVSGFGESLQSVAAILKANGFDAVATFDAVYDASRRVLNNPVDFTLGVALTAMHGVGYFFDDLKDHLVSGVHEWTTEALLEAGLIPSGFSIAEITTFAVDLAGLTVERVMQLMQAKGAQAEEVIEGLVNSTAATVDEIVRHAVGVYQLSASTVAALLTEAGATAEEIAEGLVRYGGQTLDQVVALLKANGFDAVAAFDAIYGASRRVLNHPVDFSLGVALTAVEGVGYFFEDLKNHLISGVHEWTTELLLEVGLIPSGFSIAEVTAFAVDLAGLTVQRVLELMASKGIPVEQVLEGLVASTTATMDEIVEHTTDVYGLTAETFALAMFRIGVTADRFGDKLISVLGLAEDGAIEALKTAGYGAEQVGDWLWTRYQGVTNRLERVAGALANAGFVFDHVADWVWQRSGNLVNKTVGALRFAQYSARQVFELVAVILNKGAAVAFAGLESAGYGAFETAEAAQLEAQAGFVEIGGWLSEYYSLGLEETLDILDTLGADLGELLSVLVDVYQGGLDLATSLVVKYGYTVQEIIANFTG